MLKFKQSNNREPGSWQGIGSGETRSAYVTCPICEGSFSLRGREISKEGVVGGYVSCPYNQTHINDEIQLEGWGVIVNAGDDERPAEKAEVL